MVKKESLLSKLGGMFGSSLIKLEKNRLEAFLDSVPQAYCGWDSDGTIAWNDGFVSQIGLEKVDDIADIQNRFEPEDGAVLEGQFRSLRETGQSFQKTLALRGGQKFFRISGYRGKNLDENDRYDVLWLEDITPDQLEKERLKEQRRRAEEELRLTQEATDRTPFPVWLRNPSLDINWCNQAYVKAAGKTAANVIAQQIELQGTVFDEKSRTGRKEKIQPRTIAERASETKASVSVTGHMIIDGKRRLFRFQEIPLRNNRGFLGLAQDMTEEEELRDELNRYIGANYELLEYLHSSIAIFDSEQKLTFYNSSFSQLWELEDHYLNGKPKLGDMMEKLREQRMLPEQADFRSFKKSWVDMFTGLIDAHEDMLYLPDGKALRMLTVPHPLGGLMMIFEDVSSSLELESSYNTLIAVQKETIDNLAEGVSVIGSDGRLKLFNPSFATLWNLDPQELETNPHVTQVVEKMKPFFDAHFWPEYYDQLIGLGLERIERAGRVVRADDLVVDYVTVPLPDGGVLVTYTDMTDTVQVEQALREKNTALETAERLKLDFLANVSYQLRTPLNSIMGFTEMLHKEFFGKLNKQQKDYTKNIMDASDRLLHLVNDILDLSTIEAGYLSLEKSEINVAKVLKALSRLVREWARQKKIDIHLDCPDDIGVIPADERRIKQVILNLLRNAIAFTPEDGTGIISIAAEKDGNRILISVKDNGIGIPPEEQERIFEPFERSSLGAENAASSARGAGLGLSLVKNIIELHGGSIKLDSRPHEGTEVTIVLPTKAPKKVAAKS